MERAGVFVITIVIFLTSSFTNGATFTELIEEEGWIEPVSHLDQNQTTKFTNFYYFVSTYKATHSEALQDCQMKYSGHLVSILDHFQDEAVEGTLYAAQLETEHVWTAGKYVYEPSRWEWVTIKDPISFNRWYAGYPNGTTNLCVSVHGSRETWGWRTQGCLTPNFFLCQYILKNT